MKLKYRYKDYLIAISVWSVLGFIVYGIAHRDPPYAGNAPNLSLTPCKPDADAACSAGSVSAEIGR